MNHVIPSPGTPPRTTKRESFARWLAESGYRSLAFLGSSIRYFGWGPIIGLLLGIAITYGYAFIKPLPYTERASTEPKKINLSGRVLAGDTEPLKKRFEIGILVNEEGPFENPQGSYNIAIDGPLKEKYKVAVWTPGYYPIRIYELNTKTRTAGNEYFLDDITPFPTDLGILEGEVFDHNQRPFDGIVEVAGRKEKVVNGKFEIKYIPLGRSSIKFKDSSSGQIIDEDEITLELTGPTPTMKFFLRRQR